MKIAMVGPLIRSQEIPGNVGSLREAALEGFAAHGFNVLRLPYGTRPDVAHVVVWGWRQGEQYRRMGYEVLVMERGYIGNRFHYTSLGFNGLNGWATFPAYPDDGGARFKEHGGVLKPWRRDGEYALILGQVPHDASLRGKNMLPWYMDKAKEIEKAYGIPVHFRPHPDLQKRGLKQFVDGCLPSTCTLDEALGGALFTVCFNSNSAVDSILAGVPCVAGDIGTMAWEVASRSIDVLRYPEREAWAHKLAFTQWNPDELRSGKALEEICKTMKEFGQ